MTTDINKEIEELASDLAKSQADPKEVVFETIRELGPEGIRAKLPTLEKSEQELLFSALEEMKKAVSMDKDYQAKYVRGNIKDTVIQEDKADDDQDEKLVKPEAAKMDHQGTPTDGWEGQVIKGKEPKADKKDKEDKKEDKSKKDLVEAVDEVAEQEAEEKVEEHEESMHIKNIKKSEDGIKAVLEGLKKSIELRLANLGIVATPELVKSEASFLIEEALFEKEFSGFENSDFYLGDNLPDEDYEEEDSVEKAGKGPGSRGGKVVGRTKSGKPIYESSKAAASMKRKMFADKLDPKASPAAKAKARAMRNDRRFVESSSRHEDTRSEKFEEKQGATPGKRGDKIESNRKEDSKGIHESGPLQGVSTAGDKLGEASIRSGDEKSKKMSELKEMHREKLKEIKQIKPKLPDVKKAIWTQENELLKAMTGGRNHHFSLEEYIQGVLKDAENQPKEEIKKSETSKEDLNEIIAKGGDCTMGDVQVENMLKANKTKVNGSVVKSFSENEIAQALGLTEEEAKKLLGE
mgnify:CR=1 FL=1